MATEVLRLFVRAGAGSGICNMILTEKKKKDISFHFDMHVVITTEIVSNKEVKWNSM